MTVARPLRVAFAGTPEFAAVALRGLLAQGHCVPLVLTQPDRPAGRGLKPQPSAVKQVALTQGLPVIQPRSLRLDGRYPEDAQAAREALQTARLDAMVVAAYGLILPLWVLQTPRLGCLNIHASLLPRWRGAAPIHRAIEAGDDQTGVTLMQMDEGLDTGAMWLSSAVPIDPQDTTGRLHDRLAALGAELVGPALALADAAVQRPTPQPAQGVTYAHKIDKHEAWLDWAQPAEALARRVRAFDPFPGALTEAAGDKLKIWAAQAEDSPMTPASSPGTVLQADAQGLRVQTGQGVLRLTELQRPGGRRLPVGEFLRGSPLAVGQRLAGSASGDGASCS